MTSIAYLGDPNDLEGLTLKATFSQEGKAIDRNVKPEVSDSQICFEMVDAKYQQGVPVEVEIRVSGGGREIQNGTQEIDLGDYTEVPFMGPILAQSDFRENPLHIVPTHGYEEGEANEWYATDLCSRFCGPSGNYESYGIQVYMPFSIKVLYVSAGSEIGHNIVIQNPYTGHVFLLGHQVPSEELLARMGHPSLPLFVSPNNARIFDYDQSMPISYWCNPSTDMIPHLHIEGQVFRADHPDLWAGVYIMDGPQREGNCLPDQDYGPCPPRVLNISIERYLINGWLNPDL